MALNSRHDQMNRALDGLLDEALSAEWYAYLADNPQEAQLYEELELVDRVLRDPPMVAAPLDFATNVMLAIRRERHLVYARQPRITGPVLALALGLGALIALPLLGTALLTLVQTILGPGALIVLLQGLIRVMSLASSAAEQILRFLGDLLAAYPMAPALLLTAIPMVMLWGWLVWFLRQRERPATVVIPVRAA